MRGCVVKLPNDNFLIWSTVADAPLTHGMPREIFTERMTTQYGHLYDEKTLGEKIALADRFGSSKPGYNSLEELIEGNCAGPDGSSLTLEEIVEIYGDDSERRALTPSV